MYLYCIRSVSVLYSGCIRVGLVLYSYCIPIDIVFELYCVGIAFPLQQHCLPNTIVLYVYWIVSALYSDSVGLVPVSVLSSYCISIAFAVGRSYRLRVVFVVFV